jgi:hypothetical protein
MNHETIPELSANVRPRELDKALNELQLAKRDKQQLWIEWVSLATERDALAKERDEARELLREIRDGEVNAEDESDKYLRDSQPSELSRVRAERDALATQLKQVSLELDLTKEKLTVWENAASELSVALAERDEARKALERFEAVIA